MGRGRGEIREVGRDGEMRYSDDDGDADVRCGMRA